ncbi:MAG: FAD:protein FMN transferase [Acidobacteriota bacterium]
MVHRFQHVAMATQFEIRCTGPDVRYARQAARAAFAEVDRLEQQLSRFLENSDITRINHLTPGDATIVGYETMQCLRLACLIHEATDGAFDPALGAGFERVRLDPEAFIVSVVPGPESDPADGEAPASQDAAGPLQIDLGAIGKGFAIDRVAEVLEDWEMPRALIDAGSSSVLALDPPEGDDGWPLTISEPGSNGPVLATVCVCQVALGASGIRKPDHIVDPRSRTPVRSRAAAWVSAPRSVLAGIGRRAEVEGASAAVADALSTAFMIAPVECIRDWCGRYPGLEAWILEDRLTHFPAAVASGNR